MSKIMNSGKSMMIIGRFKVLPGEALPGVPFTVREKKDIKHFLERGMLKTDDGKMPDFLLEKKDGKAAPQPVVTPKVEAKPAPAPVVETPKAEAPAEEPKVEAPVEEAPKEEAPVENNRRSKK